MKTIHKLLPAGLAMSVSILSTVGVWAAATPAPAATQSIPYQLTTSPVSLNVSGKPGTSVSSDLRVRNDAPTPQKIHISTVKFGAEGEEGRPYLADRGPKDDYFDWVKFSVNDFELPANAWQTVKMTINIPLSAANGYYYGIRFSRVGDDVTNPGKQTLAGSNTILVLLDAVNPNAKRQLEVISFEATKSVYEALPSQFQAKLRNTGNVHIVVAGSVFIMQGKKNLAVIDFNKAGGNILPGSNRIFTNDWSDGFPHFEVQKDEAGKDKLDKLGKPIYKIKWNFDQIQKIRFGQYTAKLVAVYQSNDGKDMPLEAEVSFWVIPWRLIGVIVLVLLFVPIGMYATGRTIWKKAKHRKE